MTNYNSGGQDSDAPPSGFTEHMSMTVPSWRSCINSSSSRRGADVQRRLPHAHGGGNNSSSDAACSFASPRGWPDVDGAEPATSQQEKGEAEERMAEPGHAIAALSPAPSQPQPPRSHWGCVPQVLFAPRSARSLSVFVLSLALAAGGLHGAAAHTCPTYSVTPAVQANCTTPTYDPTTCILRTWCHT